MHAWFIWLAVGLGGCSSIRSTTASGDPRPVDPDRPGAESAAGRTSEHVGTRPGEREAPLPAGPPSTATELLVLLHRAEARVAAGAYDEALALYREATARAPERLDILLRAGNTCLRSGALPEAQIWFETAYRLGDRSPGLTRTLGELAMTLGDPEAALAWVTSALVETPDDPALRLRRVYARVALDDAPAAAMEAEALTRHRSPEVAGAAFYILGVLAHREQRLEDARRAWRRAFDLGIRDPEMLATWLADDRASGRDAEAAARCERLTQEDAALAARVACPGGGT